MRFIRKTLVGFFFCIVVACGSNYPNYHSSDIDLNHKNFKEEKNPNSAYNPNDIYYMFDILIVSGTKAGNTLKGIVSFPYNTKDKNFSANRFILHYMQDCYEIDDLDANPTAHINNNNLHNLTFVGGPNHNRFGLNAGFSRSQFMRESEIFVQNGAEYFGYLNPYTYVDGAGIVSYKKLDTNSEAIYKDMVCK